MIKKIIYYLALIKNISFEMKSKKKFCLIENNLNKSLSTIVPKKNTVNISIHNINFFVLLNLIINKKLSFTKNFTLNYYIEAIKFFKCSVVLSMIDNNLSILKIKKHLKKIKVIVVQNGTRFLKTDKNYLNINNKKKLEVDYYFTFNRYYSRFLSKFVKAKFISLGSVENNKFKLSKNKKKKTILFISDYDEEDYLNLKKNYKSYKNYYKPEFKLLPLIEKFCEKNDLKLKISPRTNDNPNEFLFYSKILKKKWILPKKKPNSFAYIDEAQIVIFIDSTLGYEALFRRAKIAGFCCRGHIDKSRCFGWPKFNYKNRGFFWTNELDIRKCNKILLNLINMSQKEWFKKSNRYIKNFSIYNYNNTKLKNIISNL